MMMRMSEPVRWTNDDLFGAAYAELHELAAARLAGEPSGNSLQTTALVHEVYLRLAKRNQEWTDRSQILAAAAQAMRRILVDHARRRGRVKRGKGVRPVSLDGIDVAAPTGADEDLLALAEALEALAAEDADKARLVELRAFGGLTLEEAADALGVSRSTAARSWAYAKAWLYQRLAADLQRE
jgi:RNA polymerase sigma factor (TIGR02999 family)